MSGVLKLDIRQNKVFVETNRFGDTATNGWIVKVIIAISIVYLCSSLIGVWPNILLFHVVVLMLLCLVYCAAKAWLCVHREQRTEKTEYDPGLHSGGA